MVPWRPIDWLIDWIYIRIHMSANLIFSGLINAIASMLVHYSAGLGNNNTKSAWQSGDGRVTVRRLSRDRPATFFQNFAILGIRRQKVVYDSRSTVAWPPMTVAWPFSDFFQNFAIFVETSKQNCLTVSRRSRDHPTTVAWPFSDFFSKFCHFGWNIVKSCLIVDRRSRDRRRLSRNWLQRLLLFPYFLSNAFRIR